MAIRVAIDRKTGDYDTYRYWTVVADEDHEIPACQLAISDLDENEWKIGDIKEEQIESIEFGRIAATQAKQVIIQKSAKLNVRWWRMHSKRAWAS